jgi:c-di-AMP phosphodiesterase-like protein
MKKQNYKNVFKIFLLIIIIIIIIIIINIIIIIIIEKNVYYCEDFDISFFCFVEFFAFVLFLKEKDWKKISKSDFEENLKKKFMCVVYFFAEFSVFENVSFDCEFCNSILIFSLLFMFKLIAFLIFSSILKNSANEN